MADGGVARFEHDPFTELGFTPDLSTVVAGCLRRGRGGAGVEVAMHLSDGTEVVFDDGERALIAEYVDEGSAVSVCRVIRDARNNRIRDEEPF